MKTIGELVDQLITTNLKLYFAQEIPDNAADEEVAELYRKCQTLNVRRNDLIRAIDKLMSMDSHSPTGKTYK